MFKIKTDAKVKVKDYEDIARFFFFLFQLHLTFNVILVLGIQSSD